jgi:DNA repair photolyase
MVAMKRGQPSADDAPLAAPDPQRRAPGEAPERGRGATFNPQNRFRREGREAYDDGWNAAPARTDGAGDEPPPLKTTVTIQPARTIIARNASPDIPFTQSINPYQGCEHGCIYCYARPTHEYLGFSAGLDFESKIMVKTDAPELLEAELMSPRWKPQTLVLSGVTDPYQPVERKLRITRCCLEVLAKFRNPTAIITKNRLVTRDADVLGELASYQASAVNVSVTSLDPKLQQVLEPRTSAPAARLEAIAHIRKAGIPVGVMVAPIIPGLTDHEVPKILQACAEAGAQFAGYTVVRLPWAVAPLFERWLEEHFPDRKEKVLGRLRDIRGNGRINGTKWHARITGEGFFAEQISNIFEVSCRRVGMGARPNLSTAAFRRPIDQMDLFR